jgi:hypothetical protein
MKTTTTTQLSEQSQAFADEKFAKIEKEKKSFLYATIAFIGLILIIKFVLKNDLNIIYVSLGGGLIFLSTLLKIFLYKKEIQKIYDNEEYDRLKNIQVNNNHKFYLNYLKEHYENQEPELYDQVLAVYHYKYDSRKHKRNKEVFNEILKINRAILDTEHFEIVQFLQERAKNLFYKICDYDGIIHKGLHKQLFLIEYDYCLKSKNKNTMKMCLNELKKMHNWDEEIQELSGRMSK